MASLVIMAIGTVWIGCEDWEVGLSSSLETARTSCGELGLEVCMEIGSVEGLSVGGRDI